MLYFISLLMANGIFWEVYVNSMLVQGMHGGINIFFGCLSIKFMKHNTIPLLIDILHGC